MKKTIFLLILIAFISCKKEDKEAEFKQVTQVLMNNGGVDFNLPDVMGEFKSDIDRYIYLSKELEDYQKRDGAWLYYECVCDAPGCIWGWCCVVGWCVPVIECPRCHAATHVYIKTACATSK